jgi:hypothetical protein
MIISINSGSWRGGEVIRLVTDLEELVKVALKRGVGKGIGGWGKWDGGCWVLWPLCVCVCISVVVVEGAGAGGMGFVQ